MIYTDNSVVLVVLGLYLLVYFVVHSLLASLVCKRWVTQHWPQSVHYYRLFFNLVAILMLLPVAWVSFTYAQEPLWQWPPTIAWLFDLMAVLALIGFLHSLRDYDLGIFLGLQQWRLKDAEKAHETFKIGFWHRFVRHPWYFFLLVILWSREPDALQLLLYSLVTAYLFIGSRLEEGKLVDCYGEVYQRYRNSVPGLIPLPWRWLNKQQAEELSAAASYRDKCC